MQRSPITARWIPALGLPVALLAMVQGSACSCGDSAAEGEGEEGEVEEGEGEGEGEGDEGEGEGEGECTPESDTELCARIGKDCGTVTATDNCDAARPAVDCGACLLPEVCGGAAVANVCGVPPANDVPTVDPDATPETRALLRNLRALAPTHTMLGMQDALGMGVFMRNSDGSVNWDAPDGVNSDIRVICGSGPAVVGNDVSSIVGDWWIGFPNIEELKTQYQARLREEVQLQHARGGMYTLSWHQSNPVTGEDYRNGPHELWRIVPPEACDDVVAAVPGLTDCGTHFEVFRAKIDDLADWLNTLEDDNGNPIPIVVRPFHENNGGWFWWGANDGSGSTTASVRYQTVHRAIWQWMVTYVSQTKNVHNVLWAMSPNGTGGWHPLTREEYLSFGPGLDLVDVLGYDFYATDLTGADEWGSGALPELAMLTALAEETDKVAAMTEGGSPGGHRDNYACDFWTRQQLGPILNDPAASRIAWYLTWTNTPEGTWWGPVPGSCSEPDFLEVCEYPDTLLEGEADLYADP